MADETPPPVGWTPPDWFKKYLWHVAAMLVFMAATAGSTFLFIKLGVQPIPVPAPPPPAMEVAGQDAPPPNAFGWVSDPEAVDAVVAGMAQPLFAQTPAGRVQEPPPKFRYLWKAQEKVTGKPCPAHDQNPVGSCVAFGSSRAFEMSLAGQIAAGEPFEFKHLCEEAIYALMRHEIGGDQIRGDGGVGAWAAKGFTGFGGLPKGVYGRHDLTSYSPARCRDWGRTGLPDDLEPEAKRFPAGDARLIRTADEAKLALAQHYGVAVCSNQGFARQRDQNGVCRPQGTWAHCMCIDGYHTDENGKVYFHITNSWGPTYHTGPVGWGEPNTAGFWTTSEVVDRMIRSRDRFGKERPDTWAFSAVKGFPAKTIDWFVHARPLTGDDRHAIFDRPALAALAGADRAGAAVAPAVAW